MVLSTCSFIATSIISISSTSLRGYPITSVTSARLKFQALFNQSAVETHSISSAQHNSLKALGWDSLCDSVSGFAGTSLGRVATKLWSLNQTYEESLRLLDETNAAVQMHRHGGFSLDFSRIDVALVKSAIKHARRDSPVSGYEALAVVSLMEFAETLQYCLKLAIKEDADWHGRFMPLTELILHLEVNQSLITLIRRVIDEDGSVKDSASPALRRSREQVQMLEKKLHQLMESLIRSENESSFEVSNVGGRWCLKSGADSQKNISGLLLSSSGRGSIIEPLVAIPLNDELQQARASVAKAEEDVLLMLTKKLQVGLEDTEQLLDNIIKLDVINARATYGLSYGGTCPDLFLVQDKNGQVTRTTSSDKEWMLFLPKAHHPLLLQKHKLNLKKARKDVRDATIEIGRRKMQPERLVLRGENVIDLAALKEKLAALEESHPVPFDFFISRKTKVLVITGPNTGGKTACLKTVGLATMMAKSGLYVLASESVKIPWFDSVFADIGDEQSLAQSLSTFSAHLKQISDIRAQSTNLSLVLLDEVGAGTNPLEGAALGMSLLESFAESCLLTIGSTHHGELKTLKYSNDSFENACMEFDEVKLKPTYKILWGIPDTSRTFSDPTCRNFNHSEIEKFKMAHHGELKTLKYSNDSFENACMEFDEVKLKPTYKILWGIPGRSNAISIAERLGLPNTIINSAREIYGSESTEINEVIVDMEKFKQESRNLAEEAQHHLKLSKELKNKLIAARRKIEKHRINLQNVKTREISDSAARARSLLHSKLWQFRASPMQNPVTSNNQKQQNLTVEKIKDFQVGENPSGKLPPSAKKVEIPSVGSTVHVSSLGRKVTVVKVDAAKEEVVVVAGKMKMKLKLADIGF